MGNRNQHIFLKGSLSPFVINEIIQLMVREKIKNSIKKAIQELQNKKIWPDFDIPEILLEHPEETNRGDYATNVAFKIAPLLKKKPIEAAEELKNRILSLKYDLLENITAADPGFINFFIKKDYLQKQVAEILKQKEKFGQVDPGKGKKINVEFVSANPTGPLHVGNARGGFCGDVLANVLAKAGHKVTREYYVNDMGRQIELLRNSLEGQEPAYKNPYIDQLKEREEKDEQKAAKFIVNEIKKTVSKMGIRFDVWFWENELYGGPKYKKVLAFLEKKDLIYKKGGAVWFRATKFGDDKDRVLIKALIKREGRGQGAYFLSEVLYLQDKFQRGFDNLIIFLGAEHHGYINRLKAGTEALGYSSDKVKPIIMQLVHLLEQGREVKMSKRTGIYVTIDELLDEVGLDVSRFFFLTRGYGSHLNFDLDLAKQQSEKNPVYYVQYAHARICSIIQKAQNLKPTVKSMELLVHPSELGLMKQLIKFPEIIEDTAKDYQVQRLPQYAMDLATSFHQFYRDCRVISDNENLSRARLALVSAAKVVLRNTLDTMGISAPEKM